MADANLKLKQVRSPNGASRKQRESLKTLGLGRIGATSDTSYSSTSWLPVRPPVWRIPPR